MNVTNDIIFPALREAKETLNLRAKFEVNDEVSFMGPQAVFDSLAFVSFVILLEEKITDASGKQITLVDDKAFSSKNSPFKDVKSLAVYIEERMKNE